jgi:nicotinamidase-related amidase
MAGLIGASAPLRRACRSRADPLPRTRKEIALNRHVRTLDRDESVLLVVDLQESYRGKLHREEAVVAAARRMLEAAGILGIPVVVTEQYPKGLGRTRAEIAEKIPADSPVLEKTTFSALGAPEVAAVLEKLGRSQVVVIGIETHVCVNQSVHDLLARRYAVHLVRDAITSRFPLEDETGWQKLVASGAVATTTECALFEWLEDAKHPAFKAIHQLVV